MRLRSLLISSLGLVLTATPLMVATVARAQDDDGPGNGSSASTDEARKQRLDREMQTQALPLPPVKADGPCPFVKVLYDAARTIGFKGDQQASAAVTYSGEIEGLIADCSYKGTAPIVVSTSITFLFGRGPQADASRHSYTYWVAVTDRDQAVLAKEYFTVNADFPAGQDRVTVVDKLSAITIPRAANTVSGSNFEILVGFDITPQMAEFNRQGARFRVNAIGDTTPTAAGPQAAR